MNIRRALVLVGVPALLALTACVPGVGVTPAPAPTPGPAPTTTVPSAPAPQPHTHTTILDCDDGDGVDVTVRFTNFTPDYDIHIVVGDRLDYHLSITGNRTEVFRLYGDEGFSITRDLPGDDKPPLAVGGLRPALGYCWYYTPGDTGLEN